MLLTLHLNDCICKSPAWPWHAKGSLLQAEEREEGKKGLSGEVGLDRERARSWWRGFRLGSAPTHTPTMQTEERPYEDPVRR